MNKPHMTLPNGDVIHEGGYGVTRDGRKVGPITKGRTILFGCEPMGFSAGSYWYDGGFCRKSHAPHNHDIVAAWVEDNKPAKDPNRPRPAHKLKLQKGDVVRHVGWQDGREYTAEITVGVGRLSFWLQGHIDTPLPKGQRPLFVVVSRAKPTDTRNRLAFAENAMLEDGMTPEQIRDHMRRYADVIDGQICGMEATP